MLKAKLTVGISASGKSTWAEKFCKENGWYNSNRDDIRFTEIIKERSWDKYKFTKENENRVTQLQEDQWKLSAQLGQNLVVSDTNLSDRTRNNTIRKLEELGYEVELVDFPVTYEEALRRDTLRANGVGAKVIYGQWQNWLKYSGRKQYVPDTTKLQAVMFDIDGTLAHMVGRGPFDWSLVGQDDIDHHVAVILDAYDRLGYSIILLSGRDSVCRPETEAWLKEFDIPYTHLFMRPENNMQKDSIVKEELFFTNVAPYYNVEAVFDDRPQVVRMWHDIGIPKVIAVANQCIEF